MPKTLTEAQVTTANARSRLGPGVHWRRLDAEAHLGYRKGKQGGVWFVRWRNHHEGGNYKQVPGRVVEQGVARDMIEGFVAVDAAPSSADHHGEFSLIVQRGRFRRLPDRFTVRDQAGRKPPENFGVDRLFESAFLNVIIVIETDTEDFRRLRHRRQYPNGVQVDGVHGQKVSACARQICTLRNQFGSVPGNPLSRSVRPCQPDRRASCRERVR